MGAKSSKTKPNATDDFGGETYVVTVDPRTSFRDDLAVHRHNEHRDREIRSADLSPVRPSKVQEIFESKTEARKGQVASLGGSQGSVATVPSLDLDFSSSEDSGQEGSDGKRKGRKKRSKKRKGKKKIEAKTMPQQQSTGLADPKTPTKIKLGELKTPRTASLHLPPPGQKKENFEQQIKVAYSMDEYKSREAEDVAASPTIQDQPQQQQQQTKDPSPQKGSNSPSRLFGSLYETWKKPLVSRSSNRSLIAESRDPSRRSPTPLLAQSNSSSKLSIASKGRHAKDAVSTSQRSGREDSDEEPELDLEDLDRETVSALQTPMSRHPPPYQSRDVKYAEQRAAVAPESTAGALSAPTLVKHQRSERRNLRIDDMDESIMDTILAEVE